jgi:hypothetical protein
MAKRQIGYSEDDEWGGYEWSLAAVYEDDGRFYIINDSGCSCDGPSSNYTDKDAVVGPAATLGGLLDELHVDQAKHSKLTKEAFLDAVKTINNETLESARKAIGL